MDQFLQAETLIIELLLIVSLVAIAVRRLRIPYTIALVVAGLIITTQSPFTIDLTPELILTLFVPPLVFEAAFHLNFADLRRNIPWILILAVPGVVVTMLIVGGILTVATPLSLPIALVFGALISATDPVAVVALFRTLGVPKRLSVLAEGESLMNDGTAIVIFNLALLAALSGKFSLAAGLTDFVRVAAGGVIIGLVLGWLVSRLISYVDDYLIETTLTTVLAFGAYLLAERLQFSGVLAVVAAGIVNGNIGPQGMSPTTRIVLYNFWEYVAFLANSLVFLMIGLDVNIGVLVGAWQPILWAVVAVLAARFIVVVVLGWIANRFAEPVPIKWQMILSWGGLRGAISLALALSLPAALGAAREQLRIMTFGVALFTLLVQGLTMRPLVERLRIIMRTESQTEYEIRHARLVSVQSAEKYLARMREQGTVSVSAWATLRSEFDNRVTELADRVRELLITEPALVNSEIETANRELLRVQRGTLQDLRREGVITEETFEKLSSEVDFSLQGKESSESPAEGPPTRTVFNELALAGNSFAVGKTVADLQLPDNAVFVSIRRGRKTIIPRGETKLVAGDVITVLSEDENVDRVRKALLSGNESLSGSDPRKPD